MDAVRGQPDHRHDADHRPLGPYLLHGLGPHPSRPTPPTWRTLTTCGGPSASGSSGRAESPDAIHWSDPETVLLQDELDYPDTEFYELNVTPYEGMYLGMLWIFRTTNLTHHPELVVSRDGVHFERNYREPFVYRGGRRVDFDHDSIYLTEVVPFTVTRSSATTTAPTAARRST